jgi:hypothetical protein
VSSDALAAGPGLGHPGELGKVPELVARYFKRPYCGLPVHFVKAGFGTADHLTGIQG